MAPSSLGAARYLVTTPILLLDNLKRGPCGAWGSTHSYRPEDGQVTSPETCEPFAEMTISASIEARSTRA